MANSASHELPDDNPTNHTLSVSDGVVDAMLDRGFLQRALDGSYWRSLEDRDAAIARGIRVVATEATRQGADADLAATLVGAFVHEAMQRQLLIDELTATPIAVPNFPPDPEAFDTAA